MDDEKNFTVVRSIRISPEHQRKVAEAGINLSEFLRKKLDDEFSEEYLIEQQIGHHERQLMKWRERRQRQNEKQKLMFDLSDGEVEFLVRTRELLNEKPEFLQGRIQLYANRFAKPFSISNSDFQQLMNIAEEKKAMAVLRAKEVNKEAVANF